MSKKSIDLSTDSSTSETSKENCCLICSILSSLSNINCCPEHLVSLTSALSKRKHRFHRYWKKQRPVLLTSFSKNDHLLSPNISTSIKSRRNHHLTMNKQALSSPIAMKRKRLSRKSIPTSTDQIESNSPTPRILLKRVIHVKDDDEEEPTFDRPQIILNMSQATKQMTDEIYGHPKILLKRIPFEQ